MKFEGHVRTWLLGRKVTLPVVKTYESGSVLARLDTGHLMVVKPADIIAYYED